ncbi:MAG: DUF2723 domain-containing protein [Bacteroidota bacterium]|nr:DUF2723 domain-containing protein [Bacteroidota bacterium]
MLSYNKINNITGFALLVISTLVYVLTVEPTASFWDCGEFIACAYKLQVPHPPGAPVFLLIGRIFSFFALGDVTKVAYWINISSVLSSGATIMFLFWSITLIARKMIVEVGKEPNLSQTLSIVGAGIIGSLAYTFSDTFWFSAVEAEVYAMSSFFTAIVVWAMLKWEAVADEEGADRWLLVIAYLVGLSIGIHLLNLVAIPALAYIYYFKRYKATWKGGILAGVVGLAIVGIIQAGIIPGLPTIAGKFEIFFVNNLGLPFGSGAAFFAIVLVGALIYGIYYSIINKKVILNTALLGLTFILIGYCSYAIILIRSNFNPPIDENNPEDVMSFVSYLKREQYGDRPLVYGEMFTAELIDQEKKEALYRKGDKKYEIYDYKIKNIYDPRHSMLFPRMSSKQPGHAEEYAKWTGKPVGRKPTMGDNLVFFFKYQLGHMYFRYFMWNFAGREGDIQDAGWLRPWDSKAGLPESIANNKMRNQYYMLPLLLGLLGFLFQYNKNKRDFLVLVMLFVLTGIALVVYLNPPPIEPRERDYIYVGSFYVFAIWIGLGVLGLIEYVGKIVKSAVLQPVVATGLSMLVPIVMAADGWNDHDRSKRYHSVDSAKNLLNSCAKNAIVFTGGDNDTFPLWYVQEVEGFRTDVRVCNLSLLNTDWYIAQMKRQAYDSDPLPISLELEDFLQGKNDYLPYVENPAGKNGINLPIYLQLVKNDDPAVTVQSSSGGTIATLPSEIMILPIDTAVVRKMDFIPTKYKTSVPSQMVWRVGRGAIDKATLIMLDMISTNNWKRPIYYSSTLSNSNYIGLKDHMQMEGLAYRLMPFSVEGANQGFVNTDIMYDRMINGMSWRNMDREDTFYDENYRRFPYNARLSFYRLAAELYNEGKVDKAKEVINYCFKVIPDKAIAYDITSPSFVSILLRAGETKQALDMVNIMAKRADAELDYYFKNNIKNEMEVQTNLYILNQLVVMLKNEGYEEESKTYEAIFRKYAGDQQYE